MKPTRVEKRIAGSDEARGSIPLGSINYNAANHKGFWVLGGFCFASFSL